MYQDIQTCYFCKQVETQIKIRLVGLLLWDIGYRYQYHILFCDKNKEIKPCPSKSAIWVLHPPSNVALYLASLGSRCFQEPFWVFPTKFLSPVTNITQNFWFRSLPRMRHHIITMSHLHIRTFILFYPYFSTYHLHFIPYIYIYTTLITHYKYPLILLIIPRT